MNSRLKLSALLLGIGLFSSPLAAAEGWQQQVAQGLGKSGMELPGGIYRVGLPRTDLKVKVDGVDIKPGFALGSWLAFKAMDPSTVMVMGDLVLTSEEVNPVMKTLLEGGIAITAVHNHLLRGEPMTMYMHVAGHGDPKQLAATLHAALSHSKTPLDSARSATPAAAEAPLDLDTAAIDQALGAKGKAAGGVYQVSVPRAEKLMDAGMDVPPALGTAIAINFEPTGPGKAAITGDFVLISKEVFPVMKALRANGIEVTALHNHMLADEPRLFFMHFWANDDAKKLAQGLKAALAVVNIAKPERAAQ
jgi:hypothetical protein